MSSLEDAGESFEICDRRAKYAVVPKRTSDGQVSNYRFSFFVAIEISKVCVFVGGQARTEET